MADKKQKRPQYRTPKGIAIFPHLTTPDTKFDAAGVFHTKLALDADDDATKAITAAIEKAVDDEFTAEAKKNSKVKKYRKALPFEEDEEKNPGKLVFSFKQKHTIKREGKPDIKIVFPIFDAKGVALDPAKLKLGGGSVIRVAFEIIPYVMHSSSSVGASLRIVGVKVVELKTWGGGAQSAEAMGFEAEEGFSADSLGEAESDEEQDDTTNTNSADESSDEEEASGAQADF